MIDRTHRFHGRSSLRFVYERGKTTRGSQYALRSVINKRRSTYRLAVVVSRKVSKSAVVRNRIRRRIYEAVRQLADGITAPYDLILTVYGVELATLEYNQLITTLNNQLYAAGVLQSRQDGVHDIVSSKEH